MAMISACLGILCLIYYLIIIFYAGITADFAWIWLAAALVFGAVSVLVSKIRGFPECLPAGFRGILLLLATAAVLIFLILGGKVLGGMLHKPEKDLDYVIVLGAQVRGTVPSRALQKRLEKALEYAKENETTIFILSGGCGKGEEITEAECMRRWLTEQGISSKRLILEETSASTLENLKFSDRQTGCAKARTGILSNNFHIYRAESLARHLGYEHPAGIAADSDPILQLHYVIREIFALCKEKAVGNI